MSARHSKLVGPIDIGRSAEVLYGPEYYQQFGMHTGSGAYSREGPWLEFNCRIADEIVRSLRPRTAIDAGCAFGFLVEALLDRGVEASGFDVSTYAISQVRRDVQPHCRVGSLTHPIPGKFDLAICIEVVEHLDPDETRQAVSNLCDAADTILFSSTPDDFVEPTHINVRPIIGWIRLFREFGFAPDIAYDASFVAQHAFLLRRSKESLPDSVNVLFARHLQQRSELVAANAQNTSFRAQNGDLSDKFAASEQQLAKVRSRLEHLEPMVVDYAQVAEENTNLHQTLQTLGKTSEQFQAKIARLESDLQDARRRAAEPAPTAELKQLQVRAAVLEEKLREIESSPGWNAILRYRQWRGRFFGRGSLAERAYETIARGSMGLLDVKPAPENLFIPKEEIARFALIISGCPGDSFRYRAIHQAEQMHHLGLTVNIGLFDEVVYDDVLNSYECFVFHRTPITPGIETFIRAARELGKPVLFDTDDLVFNESLLDQIKSLRGFEPEDYKLYVDGIRRYHRTLSLTTGAIATTEQLGAEIQRVFPSIPVAVNRNAVSEEMLRHAERALGSAKPDDGWIRFAYFSGTRTHQDDFAVCEQALARIMDRHSRVRLMLAGHINRPSCLDRFQDRVDQSPLIPWQELPRLMRWADINLAPLEFKNRFTEAKSELKYFEAGMMALPTIASDLPAFRHAIQDGTNGFLCGDTADWERAMEALVSDADLRKAVGEAARKDVLERYTCRARAPELARALMELAWRPARALEIAFVLRAPIPKTGGGYKTIFRLGHEMAGRGHHVTFYVEPIAHLAGKTEREIRDFCHEHFGASKAEVRAGHQAITRSDVAIATNWPTAARVACLENTQCRMYFVQDYEPDFYEPEDPFFRDAEKTYQLPLRKIAIGGYLAELFRERDKVAPERIDFAVDTGVFQDRNLRSGNEKPRVLFFARPELKRRAFPVGAEALKRLWAMSRHVDIALYGMAAETDLGFPYENLGQLDTERLVQEMSRADIHLSFSLSNVSWVPFEAMACGCAVVEARVPSVEAMIPQGSALLVRPDPEVVSEALFRLVTDASERAKLSRAGLQTIAGQPSWSESCDRFESILKSAVFRR